MFEGKLYFTKVLADDSFVPRNKKPKPIPSPAAKPAPKPAAKGKHVQLFMMRHKEALVSIPQLLVPLVPLMGSEDVQKMLKFACTFCSGALLLHLWLG